MCKKGLFSRYFIVMNEKVLFLPGWYCVKDKSISDLLQFYCLVVGVFVKSRFDAWPSPKLFGPKIQRGGE